jgi:predicted lipoprotein with Yx(FWY)xxD motif
MSNFPAPRPGVRRVLLATALALAFAVGVVAAYAGSSGSKGTVKLRSSAYGKILVSSSGHTLYLFEADKGTRSACYGKCATNWPPLRVAGKPKAGAGATASLLGTTPRKNGKLQVTYHGHPLYRFTLDKKAGQTKGQGLDFFGGEWYVLNAKGLKVEKKADNGHMGETTTSTSTNPYGGGYGG